MTGAIQHWAEDVCRVRKGALPRVLAAFANLAISVVRPQGQDQLGAGHGQSPATPERRPDGGGGGLRGGRLRRIDGAAGGCGAPARGNPLAEPGGGRTERPTRP